MRHCRCHNVYVPPVPISPFAVQLTNMAMPFTAYTTCHHHTHHGHRCNCKKRVYLDGPPTYPSKTISRRTTVIDLPSPPPPCPPVIERPALPPPPPTTIYEPPCPPAPRPPSTCPPPPESEPAVISVDVESSSSRSSRSSRRSKKKSKSRSRSRRRDRDREVYVERERVVPVRVDVPYKVEVPVPYPVRMEHREHREHRPAYRYVDVPRRERSRSPESSVCESELLVIEDRRRSGSRC